MKHASDETIAKIEPLLEQVRRLPGLREKKTGIFYRRSKAFLHFHEHGEQVFADVRLDGSDFVRLSVTTDKERDEFVSKVDQSLTEFDR